MSSQRLFAERDDGATSPGRRVAIKQPVRFGGEWASRRVADYGSVVTGATPPTGIESYWGGTYPWITPTDISLHRDMSTSERMITERGLMATRRLPPDTVLVTCIASLGKNAILRAVGSCNQQINAIIPDARHSAEFIYYLFEHNTRDLISAAGATATSIVSKKAFGKLSFQVPPLAEQRAIAAVLTDVDALIGSLEALIAKKRAIKRAAMQQLLTGRTRLPGFEGEWETAAVDDVAVRNAGHWGDSQPSSRSPNRIRVVGAGDISQRGRLLGFSVRYFSDAQLSTASCAPDDIVMTTSGNGLGKTWLVSMSGLAGSNFVRVIRAIPRRVHGPYLAYSLRSSRAQELLIEYTATSAYPNLLPKFFCIRGSPSLPSPNSAPSPPSSPTWTLISPRLSAVWTKPVRSSRA